MSRTGEIPFSHFRTVIGAGLIHKINLHLGIISLWNLLEALRPAL